MQEFLLEAGPQKHNSESNGCYTKLADGGTRLFFVLIVLLVLFFVGGFARFSMAVVSFEPTPNVNADAIVVLTGGKQRVETGLKMLREKHASRMLISGVNPQTTLETLKRTFGGDLNIFACCVDLDHKSMDTGENAIQTAKWLKANKFKSVIIVTSNYHMPRAIIELKRSLKDIKLIPHAVIRPEFDDGRWLATPKLLRVVASEFLKSTAASLKLTRAHIGLEYPVANGSAL